MARVVLNCVCNQCGKEFEHIKRDLRNTAAAESYREWAAEHIDTCPSCYAAQKRAAQEAEAKKTLEGISFPILEGVSEKQIQYADDLRQRFIRENAESIKLIAERKKQLEKFLNNPANASSIEESKRRSGLSIEELSYNTLTRNGSYAKEYLVLTESNAKKLIEAL